MNLKICDLARRLISFAFSPNLVDLWKRSFFLLKNNWRPANWKPDLFFWRYHLYASFLSGDCEELIQFIFFLWWKVDTPARTLSTVLFFTSFSDCRGEKLSLAALLLRSRSSLLLRSIYQTWPNLTVRLPRSVKQSEEVPTLISRTLSSSSSSVQLTISTTNNEGNNVRHFFLALIPEK